jgi:nitrogen fixation NifU-like protein
VEDNKIKEIRFEGRGCAISISAMSILSEMVKDKSIEECERFTDDRLLKALGVPVKRSRLNCALLGLKALRKLLNKGAIHPEKGSKPGNNKPVV